MSMSDLPSDPAMLLSFVNTMLRDNYKSLDDLCIARDIDKVYIIDMLHKIDYSYDEILNKFV